MTESSWRRCPNCEGAGVFQPVIRKASGVRRLLEPRECPGCAGVGGFRITVDLERSILIRVEVAPGPGRVP